MENIPPCPACGSIYIYMLGEKIVCPECAHEWMIEKNMVIEDPGLVRDVNGNVLKDGDSVVVIKNLPVKGSAKPISISISKTVTTL